MQTANGARYTVWLCDEFGNRLIDVSDFLSLSVARVTNDVGVLELTLPVRQEIIDRIVLPDGWVEVWRDIGAGDRLLTDTYWHLQRIRRAISATGAQSLSLTAVSSLFLLEEPGRFVDNFAGTPQATKRLPADDLIREIVREQIGDLASADRQLDRVSFSVGQTGSRAPIIAKSFAWRTVLLVLQEVAAVSAVLGRYVAFDIVANGARGLLFAVYLDQRGIDRRRSSPTPLILSPEANTLAEASLTEDYRSEVTAVTTGGKGEGLGRLVGRYVNPVRSVKSPFRRRETFIQATQYEDVDGLRLEAESRTRLGRPRTVIEATVTDTENSRYGRDWEFGDYVTVQAFGRFVDCRVDAIRVTVQNGKEEVKGELRADILSDDENPNYFYLYRLPDAASAPNNVLHVFSSRTNVWQRRGTLPYDSGWQWLAVSPTNPRNLVALWQGVGDWALYYSDDLGATWTLITNQANSTKVIPADRAIAGRGHFIGENTWVWGNVNAATADPKVFRFLGVAESITTTDILATNAVRVATLPTGDLILADSVANALNVVAVNSDKIVAGAIAGTLGGDGVPIATSLRSGEAIVKIGGAAGFFAYVADYGDDELTWVAYSENGDANSVSLILNTTGEGIAVRSLDTGSRIITDALDMPQFAAFTASDTVQFDAQSQQVLVATVTGSSDLLVRLRDGTLRTITPPAGSFALSDTAVAIVSTTENLG
jgi:hypothetical protein